jgi:hypothetical protein
MQILQVSKLRKTVLFCSLFLFLPHVASAEEGCDSHYCCCEYVNSIGGSSYVCTYKDTGDCADVYGGTCGHDGMCNQGTSIGPRRPRFMGDKCNQDIASCR